MEEKTKYSLEEAKERDATYSTRLHVKVRLINRETGEIKEQEIYLGDFPLMTDSGTFVINGAERVVVSQLVRSPGCYYESDYDKAGKKLYKATVMPIRGAWLEYETDSNDIFYVRIDRTRKLPVTVLLRAIGLVTDDQIVELFGEDEKILATIAKDTVKTSEEAIVEIYKKLRPGELPTVDAARNLFNNLFFDPRRYDLAKVGRYKFNQKLSIANRIKNQVAFEDIMDKETGEVFVAAGEVISAEAAEAIQNAGINVVDIKFGDKKLENVKGVIEFKNVSFAYPDEENTLNNFNLKVEPNTKIAIVGASGQGKSTLFNLLTRIFDVNSGKIFIDNVNIKDLKESELRKNISIIRQEPFIFNRSIKENFLIVDENLTLDEIRKYCKMAYLDDYIMSLPKGYDTVLGEGGVNLSGGQKQRLSIARTLSRNSKIILFDEATSALDNNSQDYIKRTIDNLVSNHTVVIVAHRLSTIMDADIIHVVDNGKVIASGKHNELLKTCNMYKNLYKNESLNS